MLMEAVAIKARKEDRDQEKAQRTKQAQEETRKSLVKEFG